MWINIINHKVFPALIEALIVSWAFSAASGLAWATFLASIGSKDVKRVCARATSGWSSSSMCLFCIILYLSALRDVSSKHFIGFWQDSFMSSISSRFCSLQSHIKHERPHVRKLLPLHRDLWFANPRDRNTQVAAWTHQSGPLGQLVLLWLHGFPVWEWWGPDMVQWAVLDPCDFCTSSTKVIFVQLLHDVS